MKRTDSLNSFTNHESRDPFPNHFVIGHGGLNQTIDWAVFGDKFFEPLQLLVWFICLDFDGQLNSLVVDRYIGQAFAPARI